MNFKTLKNKSYRIALFGTTNSGKTCILAELAMNHGSNKRLTSNKVPLDFEPLTDEQKKQIEDQIIKDEQKQRTDVNKLLLMQYNFQCGQERLSIAEDCLKKGETPEPTALNTGVRPMLEYLMGDADGRGDFYVWTEDYPGEWINPEQLQKDKSAAKQLREHLLKYDGLILVVETAVTKEQEKNVLTRIESLSGYFTSLADIVSDGAFSQIPVAIVLSKWDRYASPIEFNSPQTEQEKLERYLEEHPYYNRLIRAIRSNAQNQEATPTGDLMAGIAYGNTAVFPVSAFGNAIEVPQKGNPDKTQECPDKTCLQSFGIVEPFFWIARRCDEIKIDRLEKNVQKTSVFWPAGLKRVSKEAKLQSNRIASATPTKQRYEDVWWECLRKRVKSWLIYLCLIVLLGLAAYDWRVCWYMNYISQKTHAPTATIEELSEAREQWENYKSRLDRYLPFTPSLQQANKELAAIDNRIDDLYWEPIKAVKDLPTKAKLASEYTNKLPNGGHVVEAHKIIRDAEIEDEEKAWKLVESEKDPVKKADLARKHLDKYNKTGTAIHKNDAEKAIHDGETFVEEKVWKSVVEAPKDTIVQLNEAQNYLNKYPNGSHAQDANVIIARIGTIQNIDSAVTNYDASWSNDNIQGSIMQLQTIVGKFGVIDEKIRIRIQEAPIKIKEKLDALYCKKSAQDMIQVCDDTKNVVGKFEQFLRSKERNCNDLADLITPVLREIAKYRTQSVDKYDKELYNKFLNNKTLKTCSAYLNGMETLGGGAMKEVVLKYQYYLEHENDPLEHVDLYAYVDWGSEAKSYRVEGKIFLNGTVDMYDDNTRMKPNAHVELENVRGMAGYRPNDKVQFTVTFTTDGNWWGNTHPVGTGERTFYLSELLSEAGGKITLTNAEASNGGTVTIKASSSHLQKKPGTPSWSKK